MISLVRNDLYFNFVGILFKIIGTIAIMAWIGILETLEDKYLRESID